jgi:hypothetical protein
MQALLLAGAWAMWLYPVPGLVRDAKQFLGQRHSTALAVLSFLAFTVYAPLIAVLSRVVKVKWKGRRIR